MINSTIPLWSLALVMGAGTWNTIKFYFKVKTMQELIETEKIQRLELEKRLENVKLQFSKNLEDHKKETADEFIRLNKKLDSQGTTLTRVETMVSLLVQNKIKD